MADVVYAIEIWLLLATLLGWLFGRAACRLRQPPPTLADVLLAAQARPLDVGMCEPCAFDADAVWRPVRADERV
jgi:hypothetical protein